MEIIKLSFIIFVIIAAAGAMTAVINAFTELFNPEHPERNISEGVLLLAAFFVLVFIEIIAVNAFIRMA